MAKNIEALREKYKNMSEPLKASVWYMICNILNKGVALLSTPIFTRILTEDEYGTFSIYKSWSSILIIFTSLNIFLGGYTKGLLLFKDDKKAYTSVSLAQTTVLTGIFGIIYLINVDFWTSIFELPPVLIAAMFLELMLMPAFEFWAAKERFDYKYQKFVAISLLMTVLSLVGGVIAVINSSEKVEARVFSDVLAHAIFAITLFVIIFIQGKQIFARKYWVYNLKFNIPLLPHYLSNYVLNQSDRLMIGKMIGNDKAAYYSVAYTVSMIMLLVTSAINNSLTPYLYKNFDNIEHSKRNYVEECKKIKNFTTPIFLFVASISLITMAFAPEVIFIFAGKKYAEAIYVIPPIAASVFFIYLYSMFSTIEYYFQKTVKIAIATTISASINLILNYIFIYKFGYYAAGYTTLICYICLSIMHYCFYKTLVREKFNSHEIYDVRSIVVTSIVLLLLMVLITFTYNSFVIRYGIIVMILIGVIIKRNSIKELIQSFKK